MLYLNYLLYSATKINSIPGVFFRNFTFTVHKLVRLVTSRKNYLLWSYESEESDESAKTDRMDSFELRSYEQFWERSYHGFWPYFCRTFYDYFAPKPIHIASVWRVSRDDYHNGRSFFYRLILSMLYFFKKTELMGFRYNFKYTKFKYRKIAFRWFFLPKIIYLTTSHALIKFKESINAFIHTSIGFCKRKEYFFFKKKYLIIYMGIFTVSTLICFYSFNTVAIIWLVTNMAIIMPILLLWQTFIFFYKTYQISKYTTQNQRFWKRSLTLFWLIEGFLFAIVLFIWFISPDNLKYGINHQEVLRHELFDVNTFLITTLNVSAILILVRLALFNKITNNRFVYNITMLVIVILLTSALVIELKQVINLLTKSSILYQNRNKTSDFLSAKETFVIVNSTKESVVSQQLKFLIIFLKFWHVLFIAIYIVFNILRGFNNNLSYDSLSSIGLNCNYLFFFNLTSIVFFTKYNLYFLINSPSYHYFITNKIGYTYYILNNIFYVVKHICINTIEMLL